MKEYRKIVHLKETDYSRNGLIMPKNTQNFVPGVPITIQEKIDGSCASIEIDWDKEEYIICSHHKVLKGKNGLNGFKEYAEPIAKKIIQDQIDTNERFFGKGNFKGSGKWAIFGEWTGAKNRLVYDKDKTGKWYVFDAWEENEKYDIKNYIRQSMLEDFCKKFNLNYIKPYYTGLFISWEHCRSFMNKPQYGERQEGIVVKLVDSEIVFCPKAPKYIKIVNDDYCETRREKLPKNITPEVEKANTLADSVVTEARVMKKLNDLVADGVLPKELTIKDMSTIVKHLPKIVHDDIKEEEPEIYEQLGKLAGRLINSKTIILVKQYLLK